MTNKQIVLKGLSFVFAVFLLALSYNLLFLPNDLVIGGVSGLSIIFQKTLNINPQIFIYVVNFGLIILSFALLGKEKTNNTIIGAILYPCMITFTTPIAKMLLPYFTFNEFIMVAILAGIMNGFSNGMVYRCGYSTGGSDTVVLIMSKYLKMSEGKAILINDILIIGVGALVFGLNKAIYALIVVVISSTIVDRIIYGISNSKVFYVFTKKDREVKKTIFEEFKTGFTILPTKGGYSHENGILIMCVLTNRDYYKFKKRILELDPKAFFVICDCYESQGGYKKHKLPF